MKIFSSPQRPETCPFVALFFVALVCVVGASENGVDKSAPSWLCSKVSEVAVEKPLNNVIGFKEGTYRLVGPLRSQQVSFPEGCAKYERVHQTTGQG